MDRIVAMAHAHDFAFGGVSIDDEHVGNGGRVDDERLVAGRFEGAGQSGEDAAIVMENGRGFAVHETSRADDRAAVDVADALVSQADAEDGEARADFQDDVVGDAGFLRRAGAGRDDDGFGLEGLDFGDGDFVVALDDGFRAKFAELLDKVVGERVVVIDDEEHEKR